MAREIDADDGWALARLALAEWSSAADARVVSVTVVGDRAQVALVVNGDQGHRAYSRRTDRGWSEAVEGNAPTAGWDDPGTIGWDGDS